MIVVTAPTGRIGRSLMPLLLAQEEPIRVITRDPDRLTAETLEKVDVVVGSHRDRDVIDRATQGANTLFWLMPADRQAASAYDAYVAASIPGADAVVRHGVERVVIISALGRGTQVYGGHASASHAMEDLFRSTGAHVRALTMPAFMDNFLWQVPGIASGALRGTLPGDLRMPWVDSRDIAAVAAKYLLDHDWTGQDSVGVMGPEDLSSIDIAAILSEVTGTAVSYQRGERADDEQTLVAHGYSDAMAQSMMDMDRAAERGINNALDRTPENSTPTSFRTFAEEVLMPALGS